MWIKQSWIDKAIEAMDIDIKIDAAYSGRGMYGKECFAIVTEDFNEAYMLLFEVAVQAKREEQEESPEYDGADVDEYGIRQVLGSLLERPVKIDNLGRQAIMYWTHLQVDKEN